MSSIPLLDPKLLSSLPPVGLKALKVVEGTLTGLHQSPHKGQSIEFTEHKEYSPGDEIKHLDWKIYAKSDRYYIKQFEDETNLRAYLLLDASASMDYPQARQNDRPSKFRYASILALGLAYLLFRQRDAVGLMTFQDQLRRILPPQSKPSYLLPMAEALETARPAGETFLPRALKQIAEIARKRSLLLIFSDFFTELSDLKPLLKQLVHQGHDIALFHILDQDELDFPFKDQTLFEDLEMPSRFLQIDAHAIRPYYLREVESFLQSIRSLASESALEYKLIPSSSPPEQILRSFLLQRHRTRLRSKQ